MNGSALTLALRRRFQIGVAPEADWLPPTVSNEDELNATDEFWIERRAGGGSDSETWSEDDLNEGEPK